MLQWPALAIVAVSLVGLERTFKYAVVKLCYEDGVAVIDAPWARFMLATTLILGVTFLLAFSYQAESHDAIISNGVLTSLYLASLTYFAYMQVYVVLT